MYINMFIMKISELKEELSSIKSSSAVLGDQQPRDIVRKSVVTSAAHMVGLSHLRDSRQPV